MKLSYDSMNAEKTTNFWTDWKVKEKSIRNEHGVTFHNYLNKDVITNFYLCVKKMKATKNSCQGKKLKPREKKISEKISHCLYHGDSDEKKNDQHKR